MGPSPVDEIKSRLDIIEVIGSYIKLSKAGRNYKARCPFHSERTPSFMVSPERQIWHCFGCNAGGDIFAFVKQIEGIEFGDALRMLAQRAGVVLKRQDPAIQTKRKRLYEICELATKFFQKQLESREGQRASNYLFKDRGLKNQTIREWRLGWAPDEWHALADFLRQRDYSEQEVFDAGLTVKKESSNRGLSSVTTEDSPLNYYDRFRSRIMFPLFDIQGQVVGFAGRIFGKEDPNVGKYINTPQTVLYDKSWLLYGLNFAKLQLREKNSCIFVEGNLDVIMSHQAGIKNTVASSGTALTGAHLKIVGRYTDNLIFAFDMDLAGETATRRSIDLALENDFNVKIVSIGEKDPADLIKQSPSGWEKAAGSAIPIIDYYFKTVFAKYPGKDGQITSEDKKQIAKILLPVIKKIPNDIIRSHWIGELAKKLRVDEKALYGEMQKTRTETVAGPQTLKENKETKPEKSRIRELEERLLAIVFNYPENCKILSGSPKDFLFSKEAIQILSEFKKTIESAKKRAKKEDYLVLLKKKVPAELHGHIEYLCLLNEQYSLDELSAASEAKECLFALKTIKIKEEMLQLSFEVQDAQTNRDKKKLKQNLEKFNALSNQLIELSN
ncbi:MAG: DNA primase [Candidatus Portnoybacteria bacterium CG08_land_8_20_14_0_20_40_83]|uniref:DNA primase n=1 Tax=Candidatus Portnoybacteria bacterium CG_4_10_14_0_8_um_filter_40_50 TaxID=1974800 RepID=A0A2M7QQX9_9BACT|nr:MAG: DNA primase [Candidatus Portnoybacteria bacterium CG08_land_8_20_14_0_20_40_83]PIY74385.1 MAG: DNA primase [Candidatus Portnoybacteria bacterium CG_4_10_14_0_8_um_filter_40_50]